MTGRNEGLSNSASDLAEGAAEVLAFGNFKVFPDARRLERDGAVVSVGSRAFDLLCLLVRHAGDIVSKSELMAKAWPGLTVDESSLRFQITHLRQALGIGADNENFIKSVTGRGYCFTLSVNAPPSRSKTSSDAPPQNHSLPPRLNRIVGRATDFTAISEYLMRRRFVTLLGPGGIGKTTVALALAHDLDGNFGDGIRFLDLSSLTDPNLLISTVASTLGLVVPVKDPTQRLIDTLRDRHLLLVLDSCEHLVEAVAKLAEKINQQTEHVFLLATSRESLKVEGEFVYQLAPLEIPPENSGAHCDALSYSAIQLFMERAIAAGYGPIETDAESNIVASICRKLDGMPLAIELVASRMPALGLVEIDELIGGRLRFALRGRRTALPRHQSLSAALDWSYELITPAERLLLECLSVFPGMFTIQGACAIGSEVADSNTVLDNLEQLVAKSLVASRPRSGQARFRLLDTTRAYASEKLAESELAKTIGRRHSRYVLDALSPRSYEPGGERPGGWHQRTELLADARTALTFTFSSDEDAGIQMQLAAACARLFVEHNLLDECRIWTSRALTISGETSHHQAARVELLWAFGHAAMFTERTSQECETAFWQGLELAQQLGDLQNQFRVLSRLHALYRRTGDRNLLLDVALRSETVASKLNNAAAIARAHTFVGIARHLSGDQRAARERLQAGEAGDGAIPSLPVDHFASPRGTNILSCSNLWLLGFPDQAISVAGRLVDQTSNPDLVMYCGGLCFAARVYRWVGDLSSLEHVITQLEHHSRKNGFGPMLNVALGLKGELYIAHNNIDDGVNLLQTSVPRMTADRFALHSGALSIALVEGLAAQGRVAAALESIHAQISAISAQGDSWEMPELIRVRGELQSKVGDDLSADRDFLAAIQLADRQSALSWRLRATMSRARTAKGRAKTAQSDLEQTYNRYTEGHDTADLRAARGLLGN